jgi:hypothetical protein
MPLKLKRRSGRPHWYIHGTIRGITVRESTGVADRKAAEAIRARREWEIIQRSVFGREATATFLGAAVSYLEAGGEKLYLKPIIARIGVMPLAKIDQTVIEQTARALYPGALPATLNRQAFTPIAAVLNHAAKRGLCAKRVIERPEQPKGRVRWITFEEAETLLAACSRQNRCRLRDLPVYVMEWMRMGPDDPVPPRAILVNVSQRLRNFYRALRQEPAAGGLLYLAGSRIRGRKGKRT